MLVEIDLVIEFVLDNLLFASRAVEGQSLWRGLVAILIVANQPLAGDALTVLIGLFARGFPLGLRSRIAIPFELLLFDLGSLLVQPVTQFLLANQSVSLQLCSCGGFIDSGVGDG